jgi:glycosyltransferase involved in cell wall biosynthesis
MKEIIFIRQSLSTMGGVEWQIVKLAEKLFSRGCFKPVLITSDNNSDFAKSFAACGFEVIAVPMEKAKIFSAGKKILKILENREVAVVQTHLFRESAIGRYIRKKRPDIRHIFRAETYIDCLLKPEWKKQFYHLLDKLTSQWVDCYVVNGKHLVDEIISRSKINPNKIIVLLNGRDSIGVPDEPCGQPDKPLPAKIGMVANFVRGKGHDVLCKAIEILNKNGIKITVRLIGTEIDNLGTLRQTKTFAEKIRVLENLEFYGKTDKVYQALKDIPVIVLPSDSEGVPNCILEAMSLRKLVIASNTGGVGEIIEDKKTGLLCKPKDPRSFADCLQYVFTHKAGDIELMRNAGFEKWKKEFTAEKMVDKLVEIYRKLGVL